jgi:hypothetical protein
VCSLSWTLGGAGLSRAPRGISLSCCGSPFWWTRCPSTTPSCPMTPRPSCAVCGYVGSWGGLQWGCTLVEELCSVSKGVVCGQSCVGRAATCCFHTTIHNLFHGCLCARHTLFEHSACSHARVVGHRSPRRLHPCLPVVRVTWCGVVWCRATRRRRTPAL